MQIEIETYTAPSHWACYLFYGDPCDMDEQELANIDYWLDTIKLGDPVDCEDAGFMRYHDAYSVCPYAADCHTYTFNREV